ncbi:MAG: Smr/MutS family protein [Bacteroidales bacterium]
MFIHGVGSGRLKLYLRQQLCQNYPQLHYQDASFREYGYGATIVFL